MKTVSVSLEDRSYDINIGSGILSNLGSLVSKVVPNSKYFFVLDDNIETTHGIQALQSFDEEVNACSLTALESNKTIDSIQAIWSAMLEHGCDRLCPVIAVGGGLVGDVGGFAAATFMRGVPLIQVPTTLLAMVDASIGGKTGVNLTVERIDGSKVLGKNLAGSFWQPNLVVSDVETLKTLDDRQFRCGLAECVKHAMLGHDDLMSYIQKNVESILGRDSETMVELVSQSAAIKAEIVSNDEREQGNRALLNFGHTFAHAIEPLPELSLFHGEAVSIGICAAVSCAEVIGLVDSDDVDKTRELLTKLGLPTRLPIPVAIGELINLMKKDKKNVDSTLRLVLPSTDGVIIVDSVDSGSIGLAWASVGASSS
ncbi:MAG: 3-dehydroquinate synthase [Phycisphaerales bacterium]|jgi:3-dehydroquinate synthase|nr:3-dehydroquinate synthase [Phycisphaerales bacterium]